VTKGRQIPSIAAGGLLYPSRHTASVASPSNCADREFAGAGVTAVYETIGGFDITM
jgi:hypothetical protein